MNIFKKISLVFLLAIMVLPVFSHAQTISQRDQQRYSWFVTTDGQRILHPGMGPYGLYYSPTGWINARRMYLNLYYVGNDWGDTGMTNPGGLSLFGFLATMSCSVTLFDCTTGNCNFPTLTRENYISNPEQKPNVLASFAVSINGAHEQTVRVPRSKMNHLAVGFSTFAPFNGYTPSHVLFAGSNQWRPINVTGDNAVLFSNFGERGYGYGLTMSNNATWYVIGAGGSITNMPENGGRIAIKDATPEYRCLAAINIVPEDAPPVCTITASTPYVRNGNAYTRLTWDISNNPTNVALTHNGTRIGTAAQNTNREVQLNPGVNTFNLSGQNNSGSCAVSRSILAPSTPAPVVTNLIVRSTNPTVNHSTDGNIASDSVVNRITWSSQNATSCEGYNFTLTGANTRSGNSTVGINQPDEGGSVAYGVRCQNSAGVWTDWHKVTITKAEATTPATVTNLVVRSTNPATNHSTNGTIAHNSVVNRITWSSQNATSCQAEGFTIGVNATGGNSTTGIAQPADGSSQTYRVRCRNGSTPWSDWRSITLTKGNPPAPTITTLTVSSNNPDTGATTNHNSNSTISHNSTVNRVVWNSANAASCNGIGFNTGGATSGNVTVGITQPPVNGSTPYRVVCQNDSGQTAQREVVLSKDGLPPINLTVRADRQVVRRGDTAQVAVTINAPYPVSCTISNVADSSTITHAGGSATTVTRTSNVVNNMLPVRVSCTATASGVSPVEETTYINIVPEVSEQ